MASSGVLILVPVAALACKGSSDDSRRVPPRPAPTAAAPADPEPPRPANQAEKMRHCPVTVPDVDTRIDDIDGGVKLVLASSDPKAAAEAQRRAHHLAKLTADRNAHGAEHGGGRGGGFMRNCPVVTKDVTVEATDTAAGVDIVVRPLDPAGLADLRAASRERLARAPLQRARVVREEATDDGETKLFSGAAADLDGDGTLELVAGGFAERGGGRQPTILVYRQDGDAWSPVAEGNWGAGDGSMVRNVEVADVDGDGHLDIVALGRVGDTPHTARARLAVFSFRNGWLASGPEAEWHAGEYTHGYGLAVGDLDADGKTEIVTGGFQFDGTTETGFVRVWNLDGGELALRAETRLDGQGSPAMRVNDVALGNVAGDGKPEIVVAGRHGPVKGPHGKHLDQRRETGDLSVLRFARGKLTTVARHGWAKGTSLRLRSVAVVDGAAGAPNQIVAGGQYDADGKAALGLFGVDGNKLALRHDASSTAEGVTGEVKDLVVARRRDQTRLLATGSVGDKPGRSGEVGSWQIAGGKLVRDAAIVSRNGDETRARAVVVVPGEAGSTVLTIGHATTGDRISGQVLRWNL